MCQSLFLSLGSDAAALGRPASVVRGGRDVLDGADLEADGTQRPDGGLTTRARALDEDVDLLHALVHGATAGGLGSHLGGEGGGLARALEADGAGRGPRDHRTGRVGDRDDGVVERALDVGFALSDVLLLLAAHLGRAALGRHSVTPGEVWSGSLRRDGGDQRWTRRGAPITSPSSCRRRCAW